MIKTVFSTFFLSLRKFIVYLLGILIVIGILLYFFANSPWVIQKALDKFASDYNISYSKVYGNIVSGIQIDNLAFNEEVLSKHIVLQWNPDDLLKKEIKINTLKVDDINVESVKQLVKAFSSDDNSSSAPFTFKVNIAQADVNINPFIEENINITEARLHAKNISYANGKMNVENADLVIDSNITSIHCIAGMKNRILTVDEIVINDVDTVAIENLFVSDSNESNHTHGDSDVSPSETNTLIPQTVIVKLLKTTVLPRTYEPLSVKTLSLLSRNILFDVDDLIIKEAKVDVNATTNLSNLTYQSSIVNNKLSGNIKMMPQEDLFQRYNLPIRKESIDDIKIKLDATKEKIIATLDAKVHQLLNTDKDAFNLDIKRLKSIATYSMESGILETDTQAIIATPYAKNIEVTNLFTLHEGIEYHGDIKINQMVGIDAKFLTPLEDLKIEYRGDEHHLSTNILSHLLEGSFNSKDFKTAVLHIQSKEPIFLGQYITLPSELNQTKAQIEIDAPLNFETNSSYLAKAKIRSNVVNLDANVTYDKVLKVISIMDIPKASLLKSYAETLKWEHLNPIKAEAILTNRSINVLLDANRVQAKVNYDLNSSNVNGKIDLGGLEAKLSGIAKKEMILHSKITSIPLLVESIGEIYTLEDMPNIEGSLDVTARIDALESVDLEMDSPKIIYHSDHKKAHEIDDINIVLSAQKDKIELQHYTLTYQKEKIYATKPSIVTLKENIVSISPLWVNDQLKAEGTYDLNTKKGQIITMANELFIKHEIIDFHSNIDLETLLDGNTTTVKGEIILLDGNIHYDISKKSFASDSDIIIVQDMKSQKESPFMDGLSVQIAVKTKKPLTYNKGAIAMRANVDIVIHKSRSSELLVLGTINILKGSRYIFQEKTFILDKSFVHFTGNPNKPLLDIKVKYKAINYDVTIKITGTADMPQIDFSSKPSLSKEQILSLILFDTEAAAGTNSGDEMMKMMGGAMAKSALNNLGIKLDHLVLGEGNSIEVGKKLSDKVTIIYVNDTVSKVKLKYEHSKHMESVIEVSEESQSYDIIYKRDF